MRHSRCFLPALTTGLAALALCAGLAARPAMAAKANPAPASALTTRARVATVHDTLPDTQVLAIVGNRKITVYDFRYLYFISDATLRPQPDSLGRVQFLNDLIDQATLGQAALKTNYQFGFEDRAVMRDFRNTMLSNVLFLQTNPNTTISDDSLKKICGFYGRDLRLRLLYFPDRETAEFNRQQLISGRTTWTTALARWGLHSTTVTNGVSDWIKFANIPINIAIPVWSLRIGQVSPVIPAASGYHLVQILDERATPGLPCAAMRGTIRRSLRDLAGRKLRDEMQTEAKIGMDVVYDTTNVRWTASFFRTSMNAKPEGFGSSLTIDPNIPEFTPEDTARTLVRWKGGRLSVGNIVHEYSDIQALTRPSLNTPENMFAFIDAVMLGPKMTEMAEKRGLDKDSSLVVQLERKREEILLTHMVEDSVLSRIQVTKDDRKAYYAAHPDNFMSYPRVSFGVLVRNSKSSADSTVAQLAHGIAFDVLLAADKALKIVGSDTTSITSNDSHPYHKVLFEELRPGKWTVMGPDKTKMYAVVYEKSYDPGHLVPYEDVEGPIDESVRNIKGDQALRAFIARKALEFPAKAHYEDVMRFPLTDPTLVGIE